MEHSVTAYLGRQSTQTLKNLLEQYRQGDSYYQQFVPTIIKILEERQSRTSEETSK